MIMYIYIYYMCQKDYIPVKKCVYINIYIRIEGEIHRKTLYLMVKKTWFSHDFTIKSSILLLDFQPPLTQGWRTHSMVPTVVMSPWAKRTHRPEIPCSLAAAQVDRGPLGCTLCMVIWVNNQSIFGFVNAYLGHYVLYSTI